MPIFCGFILTRTVLESKNKPKNSFDKRGSTKDFFDLYFLKVEIIEMELVLWAKRECIGPFFVKKACD